VHSTTYALRYGPMAPTLRKGALAFGLVNIPVALSTAVRGMEKISFRQLEKQSLKPIRQERVGSVDDKPVPWSVSVRPQERRMAIQLIENLSVDFDPSKYRDEYTEQLRTIIRAKAKGKKLEMPHVVEPASTHVVDLVSRLQASLAASGAKKHPAAKKTARRPAEGAPKRRRSA
jgi:non-homologous end joining protein Ku